MLRSRPLRPLHGVRISSKHPHKICSGQLYHSYDHPSDPPFPAIENTILSAAINHVPAEGFTSTALQKGARETGYLDITINLFPSGPVALVNYHLVTQRLALSKHFKSPFSTSSEPSPPSPQTPSPGSNTRHSIPSLIRQITLHRLHANTPILPHWQSAIALLAQPQHIPLSLRELARLVDEILFLAGSKTVTSAWYTDRAGLAALYASAELYMTTDRSKGFVDTERYVESRLQEAEGLREGMGTVGTWVGGQFGGLVDGLRSKGVWI